ncbi:MAG: TolC family outer membrane protein [Parvularculaceae bacterium]
MRRYSVLLISAALICAPVSAATGKGDATGSVYDAYEQKAAQSAAEAGDETVAGSIRAALRHNPGLRAASAQKDAAKAERFRALGGFLPDIEASASYTDNNWNSSPLPGQIPQDGTTVGVTAVQPVFQGLSALNRFRAARSRVTQADLALLSAQQNTVLDAARAHAGVILARAIVAHRIENMGLVSQQLVIAQKRQEAGAQSRTGVEQARMRLAQAQVDLGQARTVLAEAEAAYVRIVGRSAPETLEPDTRDIAAQFASLEEALTIARNSNPAIGSADAGVDAAERAKAAAVGDFAPRLTLEGRYFKRYGNDAILSGYEDEYQIVARMRMPILRQGNDIAGLRAANATVSQQEAQMTATVLAVEETVMRSWRQLAEAQARAAAAKTGIEAAKMAVRGLQMEYDAGQRTVIDVLDGQRDLVIAQINESQAEFEVRASQYELTAAAGVILDAYADILN